MYLTAHRVRNPESKKTAIHVFYHRHGNDNIFNESLSDTALLKRVTETEPGTLVHKELKLSAGGNTVLSYVDIVAPDNTSRSFILEAIIKYREYLEYLKDESEPKYKRYKNVLVSFGAVFGLQGAELREYDNLCTNLKAVIEQFYDLEST